MYACWRVPPPLRRQHTPSHVRLLEGTTTTDATTYTTTRTLPKVTKPSSTEKWRAMKNTRNVALRTCEASTVWSDKKRASTEKWRAGPQAYVHAKCGTPAREKSAAKSGVKWLATCLTAKKVADREKWTAKSGPNTGRNNAKSRRERLLIELFWLARGTGHMLTACLRDSTPL